MSLDDAQFSPDGGRRYSKLSLDSESSNTLTMSGTVDMQAKLKQEDELRLKSSTARALPWFLNLIIFLIQLGIFIGFAFFAYGTKAVHNTDC